MKDRRGKTVIRLTGNQVVGYKESGYQASGSKNRTIYRNTCRKNVEIEMKFWYSGHRSLQEHINEVYMGNPGLVGKEAKCCSLEKSLFHQFVQKRVSFLLAGNKVAG